MLQYVDAAIAFAVVMLFLRQIANSIGKAPRHAPRKYPIRYIM
jgi:hypothetical protein